MQPSDWNKLIAALPEAHLLQTFEWAQVKASYNWQPIYLTWRRRQSGFDLISGVSSILVSNQEENRNTIDPDQDVIAAALVLKKNILAIVPGVRLCILYCPKGPLLPWGDVELRNRVLDDLQAFARQQGAIFFKADPDVVLGHGVSGTDSDMCEPVGEAVLADLVARGWKYSADQIQFKNTVMLDVSADDDELLSRMKQKTRYNVRLGLKKGLTVRRGNPNDWSMLYKMYAETSVRDGFVIRNQAYYEKIWRVFTSNSIPLIAEVEGDAIAAVYLFHFAGRAYYLYGMSRDAHRDLMPNYLLQFEAMRWAREKGCHVYDLWGAPDEFNERDPLWGVYRFKEGLGGKVRRTLGAWDFTPQPFWCFLYTRVMPRVLAIMRSRGRQSTRESLGN